MKTGQPIIGRPAWYDRNPIVKHYFYGANDIAPHGTTDRFTYTVPAGKKAYLELIWLKVRRRTAPTTADVAAAELYYTPSGGSENLLVNTIIRDAAVGAVDTIFVGQTTILVAGDVIKGKTGDVSTAGTCDYRVSIKATEFDA